MVLFSHQLLIGTSLSVIFIPVRLIWSVKVRWTHKVALASTLCLAVLTIVCTITRIAGMHTGRTIKSIDSIWGTYWQYVAANIALTMTAATAFRTFFVSRATNNHHHQIRDGESENSSWYIKGRNMIRSVFATSFRRSKRSTCTSDQSSSNFEDVPRELRQAIPSATMTGIRTYISGKNKGNDGMSQVMQSRNDVRDDWPLSNPVYQGITVQEDLEMREERV